jgi:hypothetical protein
MEGGKTEAKLKTSLAAQQQSALVVIMQEGVLTLMILHFGN